MVRVVAVLPAVRGVFISLILVGRRQVEPEFGGETI